MQTFQKGSEEFVSKDFRAREFDCPCTDPECIQTSIDPTLIQMLQNTRDILAVPMHITSGNRCAAYQQILKDRGYETASGISTHQEFKAADFTTGQHSGEELETAARTAGFKAVGVGKTFVHCDTRDDKERRWTYSY